MVCKRCGFTLAEGAKYCGNCGEYNPQNINNGYQNSNVNMVQNNPQNINNGYQNPNVNMVQNNPQNINNGYQNPNVNMVQNNPQNINNGYQNPNVNMVQNNYTNPQINNLQQMYPQYTNQNTLPKKSNGKIILFVIIFVIAIIIGIIIINNNSNSNNYNSYNGGNSNIKSNDDYSGVTKSEIDKTRKVKYDRTILIYMAGSDLETGKGIATADLSEIDYSKLESNNTKLVLLAGGTRKWENDYIDSSKTSIYELKESGYEIVKDQNKKNMGSGSTLTDFLNYSYNNYPSKNYVLIFWNHGGAAAGAIYDELSLNDRIELHELKESLEKSVFSKENKLELVIFRTCLNGTIEMSNVIKDYANYMVAAEDITRGYAYKNPYTNKYYSVLSSISDFKKTDSTYSIGSKFINGYNDYIGRNEYTNGKLIQNTYFIIDLSKIDNLSKSIDDFFESIDDSTNYSQISSIRSRIYQFPDEEDSKEFDMVDLYTLISELRYFSPQKADKVLQNINSATIYNGSNTSKAHGLTIYFPYYGETYYQQIILKSIKEANILPKYQEFINNFNINKQKGYGKFSMDFTKNISNFSSDMMGDSNFELELTNDQKENFANAYYIVFKDNKDGTYTPVYSGKNVVLEDNKLKTKIVGRQLKVKSNKDDTEDILLIKEKEETDDYIDYTVVGVILENFDNYVDEENNPVFLMDNANLDLRLDKKTNKITMTDVKLTSKDNIINSTIVNLKNYTTIAFANSSYKILDENGNYNVDWQGTGVLHGVEFDIDEFEFELYDYKDKSDYYSVFYIYDIYGNVHYSKLVNMK